MRVIISLFIEILWIAVGQTAARRAIWRESRADRPEQRPHWPGRAAVPAPAHRHGLPRISFSVSYVTVLSDSWSLTLSFSPLLVTIKPDRLRVTKQDRLKTLDIDGARVPT